MPEYRREWPSLEEQLRQSKVARGTALEQLVRDNQNFDVLRPEEVDDALEIPPWLRVYWRKLHPNAQYTGPSGGYPLTLGDLHEWMMEHQDLIPPTPDVVDPSDPRPGNVYASKRPKEGR